MKKPFYSTKAFRFTLIGLLGLLISFYAGVSIYGAYTYTKSTVRWLGPDTPASYGVPYESVTFKTSDPAGLTLHGWWLPRQNSDRVLIMVHSKDGTRTFLLPISAAMWKQGYNILMFDTRGQGESEGDRYSFGQYEQYDVLGALAFVKNKGFQPAHIGAVGWSMGGATTIMAMSHTSDIKAALIESSYADFDRLATERFSSVSGLPSFFWWGVKTAGNIFWQIDLTQSKPVKAISNLGGSKLFLIHDESDKEVPLRDFYALQQAGWANITDTWLVPDSEHVRGFVNYPEEYTRRAATFFERELK